MNFENELLSTIYNPIKEIIKRIAFRDLQASNDAIMKIKQIFNNFLSFMKNKDAVTVIVVKPAIEFGLSKIPENILSVVFVERLVNSSGILNIIIPKKNNRMVLPINVVYSGIYFNLIKKSTETRTNPIVSNEVVLKIR